MCRLPSIPWVNFTVTCSLDISKALADEPEEQENFSLCLE